jgi:hypothetical protein
MNTTNPLAGGSDPSMPSLARVLDSELAQPALQRALRRWRCDTADVELRSVRLIRHKPGRRALVEYQVSSIGGSGAESMTLLGTIRAKRLDAKTPAVMTALPRAGFEPDSADGVSVPEVLGEVPELQMWLQVKVAGGALTQWPADADGLALARRVTEAAHTLHGSGVGARRRHTVDDESSGRCDRFDELATACPKWRRRRFTEALLELCESRLDLP